jgi:hypothetical protein
VWSIRNDSSVPLDNALCDCVHRMYSSLDVSQAFLML